METRGKVKYCQERKEEGQKVRKHELMVRGKEIEGRMNVEGKKVNHEK